MSIRAWSKPRNLGKLGIQFIMFYRCPRYPRFIDLALRKSKPKKFSRFPRFPGFSRSRSSNCFGKKNFDHKMF